MSDVSGTRHEPGEVLRALPLLAPPRSVWPALRRSLPASQAKLPRRDRQRAVAALFVLALAGGMFWRASPPPPAPPAVSGGELALRPPSDPDEATLRELQQESMRLEALLDWSRPETVQSATTAALGASLRQRVARIDGLLARPEVDHSAVVPLWQERVLRLRQIASLEDENARLAAHGPGQGDLPVLTF